MSADEAEAAEQVKYPMLRRATPTRMNQKPAESQKSRHSRAGGNPCSGGRGVGERTLDSRLRGNDQLKNGFYVCT